MTDSPRGGRGYSRSLLLLFLCATLLHELQIELGLLLLLGTDVNASQVAPPKELRLMPILVAVDGCGFILAYSRHG